MTQQMLIVMLIRLLATLGRMIARGQDRISDQEVEKIKARSSRAEDRLDRVVEEEVEDLDSAGE